jgi:hypothetical protein
MVTVVIEWDGTEDTRDDRFNYVKETIMNLGCKPTSPIETYNNYYICGDTIINMVSPHDEVSIYVKGVDKDVFNFVIPIVNTIHTIIGKYVKDGKWGNNSYETRVSLDLYETETTCRCEV